MKWNKRDRKYMYTYTLIQRWKNFLYSGKFIYSTYVHSKSSSKTFEGFVHLVIWFLGHFWLFVTFGFSLIFFQLYSTLVIRPSVRCSVIPRSVVQLVTFNVQWFYVQLFYVWLFVLQLFAVQLFDVLVSQLLVTQSGVRLLRGRAHQIGGGGGGYDRIKVSP